MQVRKEDRQEGEERGRQLAIGETETGEYRLDNARPITHSQFPNKSLLTATCHKCLTN